MPHIVFLKEPSTSRGRAASVLTPDLVGFLQGGCGLLVGTVAPDGTPHATRAWAADIVDVTAGAVRLVVAGDDPTLLEHLSPGAQVAVTASDVRTLRSVQIKGTVTRVCPPTDDDRSRARSHTAAFFAVVNELDGNPPELLERLTPSDYAVCEFDAVEVFDQTPGPRAGCRVEGSAT
jgi:hypothetical protein